jgi:engulfment/cell motility protein 1
MDAYRLSLATEEVSTFSDDTKSGWESIKSFNNSVPSETVRITSRRTSWRPLSWALSLHGDLPHFPVDQEHARNRSLNLRRQSTTSLNTTTSGVVFKHETEYSAPSLLPSTELDDGADRPIFLLAPPSIACNHQFCPNLAIMDSGNIPDLVSRLSSDEDAVRKMAAFKLQSNVGDPSFSEQFIAAGGLPPLKYLIMEASGNTLAYSLSSFARLLDVDVEGTWWVVDDGVVKRVVELVVCHPLVNILRGAMAILVSVVSRPYQGALKEDETGGFKALKPAIAVFPQFLEMLVSRLSSADHALCANSLQLINSLMRDAIMNDGEAEWPKFIKRLQDLGVIKAVYVLMRSSALQDLAHPLLEFQALTKVLLKKWRDIRVDLQKPEHRRTIKGFHLASNPERAATPSGAEGEEKPRHNPYKWRRLGFSTEGPEHDFPQMGFLGMMDLADYIRKHEDEFQHILLEQASQPTEKRCPVARASLIVTAVLYEHFEVDKMEAEDSKNYLALESRTNFDKIFKPLLLHWSRLHVAGLHAFWRLWKATSAHNPEDFMKIVELVRILFESVVGGAARTKGVEEVEKELAEFGYERLRELQMELLELTYEDVWGGMLTGVREELQNEAVQFVKEQRIRCLLTGSWFPTSLDYAKDTEIHNGGPVRASDLHRNVPTKYRFIKLSHNRRYLHYADFDEIAAHTPDLDELPDKIDLSIVSSVVSNVSGPANDKRDSTASDATLKELTQDRMHTTKITIHGYLPSSSTQPDATSHPTRPTGSSHSRNVSKTSSSNRPGSSSHRKESVLLTLSPPSHTIASEWLDGLLMLLNQHPITAETNKLINMVSSFGLKIRLLNVRFSEDEMACEPPQMPGREGLDEEYWYAM